MKTLLYLLFVCFDFVGAYAGNDRAVMDSGNIAYAQKDFSQAITMYEKILEDNYESPALYYNLGNAYFKSNNMPKAILNYERARKLQPADEDLEVNLKLANQQITDKVEGTETHFLDKWKARFLNLCLEQTWCYWSIGGFVIFLGLIVFYLCSSRISIRQLTFAGAVLCFLLSLSTFFVARSKYTASVTHREAIVMAPNITAKGSPDEKGTDLFILHEGTKVELIQTSAGWSEIRLGNGHTGWLPKGTFEVI
jgi:tetratricopeptide (TPR) repeat protein